MKTHLTLSQRIHNAEGMQAAEYLHARHTYLHATSYCKEEWGEFWDTSEEASWGHLFGVMCGFDEVWYNSVSNYDPDGFRGYIFHAGPEKVFPYKDEEFVRMWVADMEFGVAPEILDALRGRIDRRIFGYTGLYNDEYYNDNAFSQWCKDHYDWGFSQEQLCVTPGIIPAWASACRRPPTCRTSSPTRRACCWRAATVCSWATPPGTSA